MVPRMIKYFDSAARGVRSVFCGATYSLAITDIGVLFLFGQNKKTGEANMYPKPVQDLAGKFSISNHYPPCWSYNTSEHRLAYYKHWLLKHINHHIGRWLFNCLGSVTHVRRIGKICTQAVQNISNPQICLRVSVSFKSLVRFRRRLQSSREWKCHRSLWVFVTRWYWSTPIMRSLRKSTWSSPSTIWTIEYLLAPFCSLQAVDSIK